VSANKKTTSDQTLKQKVQALEKLDEDRKVKKNELKSEKNNKKKSPLKYEYQNR
jgi:hypothetical protein